MLNDLSYGLRGEELILLPERGVYWPRKSCLIVADIHLGKAGHFRKAGIPVPRQLEQVDLMSLSALIDRVGPSTLLILGDFFHSTLNTDWQWVKRWRENYPDLQVSLVRGNHDILAIERWNEVGITLYLEEYRLDPFVFSHAPPALAAGRSDPNYRLCGHIHPAVLVRGRGHQSKRLPCFYFEKHIGVIPAFGRFTGTHLLEISKAATIFAINGLSVVGVQEPEAAIRL